MARPVTEDDVRRMFRQTIDSKAFYDRIVDMVRNLPADTKTPVANVITARVVEILERLRDRHPRSNYELKLAELDELIKELRNEL